MTFLVREAHNVTIQVAACGLFAALCTSLQTFASFARRYCSRWGPGGASCTQREQERAATRSCSALVTVSLSASHRRICRNAPGSFVASRSHIRDSMSESWKSRYSAFRYNGRARQKRAGIASNISAWKAVTSGTPGSAHPLCSTCFFVMI